jgi:hypothetical protein
MALVDKWSGLWSAVASFIFFWSMVNQHVPPSLTQRLTTWANKLTTLFNPYLEITISEHGAERFRRSDFFKNVEAYLSDACARRARKLKAEFGKDSKKLQVAVDDNEEVTDTFAGATLWWYASKKTQRNNVISWYPGEADRRYYRVVFHRLHRDLVVDSYLPYVQDEGRAVTVRNRQRCLFTNNPSSSSRGKIWSHVPFEHPATFHTLAMDPVEKEAIIDDLSAFMEAKDYYVKVGKPWKRGYLLFGPPGTGKSTMIAAMANFLNYDVYDLELTPSRTTPSSGSSSSRPRASPSSSSRTSTAPSISPASARTRSRRRSPTVMTKTSPSIRCSRRTAKAPRSRCRGCSTSSTACGRRAAASASSSSPPTTRTCSTRR